MKKTACVEPWIKNKITLQQTGSFSWNHITDLLQEETRGDENLCTESDPHGT